VKEHSNALLGVEGKHPTHWLHRDTPTTQPTLDHFVADWQEQGETEWVKALSALFVSDFLKEQRLGSFPTLQPPLARTVSKIFIKHLTGLKLVYSIATDQDMGRKHSRELQKNRRVKRRANVSFFSKRRQCLTT
jgi:hypothetical protein